MKKLFIGIVLFSFLVSCSLETFSIPEVPSFSSMKEVMLWVNKNIDRAEDIKLYGHRDYWASPEETLLNKAGDCEDMAILFAYICYEQLGVKVEFSYQNMKEHAEQHHLSVYYANQYWDTMWISKPLPEPVVYFQEEYKVGYDSIMSFIGTIRG